MRGLSLGIACALLLSACAGYSITKDGSGTGYDVYRPDPYLLRVPLAAKDGSLAGFQFEVKWLPNYSKRYRVHSWTGFGASNIQFTFTDGWKLTALHDQNDNTNVLETIKDLTKHIIPENPMKIALSGTPDDRWDLVDESNKPVLYKIMFDECGEICGLKRFRVMDCANRNQRFAEVPPIPRSRGGSGGGGEDVDPDAGP